MAMPNLDAPWHTAAWEAITPKPDMTIRQSGVDIAQALNPQGQVFALPSGQVLNTPQIPTLPQSGLAAPQVSGISGSKESGIDRFFGNKNFQNLLMGIGAGLDPEGAGGALGKAGTMFNQSIAQQEAMGEDEKRKNALSKMLFDRFGPLTPQGMEGASGFNVGRDGSVNIKYDPPTQLRTTPPSPNEGQPSGSTVPTTTPTTTVPTTATNYAAQSPQTTAPPTLTNPTQRKVPLTDIYPLLLSPGGFSAHSLQGLSPDQINAMMQVRNQTEGLRQQSIANIVNSYNIESEIASRELSGQLTTQQAEAARIKNRYLAQREQGELDKDTALLAKTQEETKQLKEIGPSLLEASQKVAPLRQAQIDQTVQETEKSKELTPSTKTLQEAHADYYKEQALDQKTKRELNESRYKALLEYRKKLTTPQQSTTPSGGMNTTGITNDPTIAEMTTGEFAQRFTGSTGGIEAVAPLDVKIKDLTPQQKTVVEQHISQALSMGNNAKATTDVDVQIATIEHLRKKQKESLELAYMEELYGNDVNARAHRTDAEQAENKILEENHKFEAQQRQKQIDARSQADLDRKLREEKARAQITNRSDKVSRDKRAIISESKILEGLSKGSGKDKEPVPYTRENVVLMQPELDEFHQNSDKPILYVIEYAPLPGTFYGAYTENPEYDTATIKPYNLPVINGKQLRARDVFNAPDRGTTSVQEYMEQVYKKAGQKAPWVKS